MSQRGHALGDRPEALEPQGVHRQAAERGQDLHAVALAIAVGVLAELGVAGPVPGILNRPPVFHVLQQRCGCGSETRDVVTGFINGLAVAQPFAAHHQDHGAARPVLHHPVRCRHAPQAPGQVTAAFPLASTGLPRRFAAVGQTVMDDLKPFAATVFHSDQEVGATSLEVGEKGRFACSASA